jgi:hypothetical protein
MMISAFSKARRRRNLPALFREFAMLSDEASTLDLALAKYLKLVRNYF